MVCSRWRKAGGQTGKVGGQAGVGEDCQEGAEDGENKEQEEQSQAGGDGAEQG